MIPKKRLKNTPCDLGDSNARILFQWRVILWATVKVSVKCYQSREHEVTNSVRCEIPLVM